MDRSGVARSFLLALTLVAHASVLLVSPAWAAAIQVTTTGDENGSNPGVCSLREAIQSANLNLPVGGCAAGEATATDRITFASNNNGSAILLSAGTLSTTSDLEIVGNGASQTVVDGGGTTQPFLVSVGAVTLIQDLAIVNGRAINGGAIANAGSLVIVNTSISGSSATWWRAPAGRRASSSR